MPLYLWEEQFSALTLGVMENIFRHATLDDQTFIKEIHPICCRAGQAHLVSDDQHGGGCKKSSVQTPAHLSPG